ncbi:MAG: osmotically inducible protein C, partial [Actinobacteria bacterium]|nr:osmotically inducible protein C [Actinomycetota bacterium]NIS28950.1 osmotically inducible protein C [Actinomycetota bacterium]NIT95139.1 osmotically inducible protein C [Actinomycetota bacterium]NIU17869.1 osmotically inducible protein C [Actinomycetota bacterium]NIU64373.1 osmotically inducible protein C [Actinomycetota bacterium]
MRSERLEFPNRRGERLAARCDLPEGEPEATALFAHCFTCTKNLRAVGAIASALTARGVAVLRFDFTGLGESEGDFAETNFTTNVEDLVAAAEAMAGRYRPPALLLGHSL